MAVTERCDRTDLLIDACGCPDHRGGQTPEEEAAAARRGFEVARGILLEEGVPGPWFLASYRGKCGRCGESFQPGDRIRAVATGHDWECCDG